MFNKESCRKCGGLLKPNMICNDCNEIIVWICKNCTNKEEYIHIHDQIKASKVTRIITIDV